MGRILVIDDSEKSRNLVKQLLFDLNHEVFLAEDAFAANDYLDKYKFDLLLLDLNMPNKSGFTFLQEIRGRLSLKLTPVVILTGRNREVDVKRAIELDALSYIVKPIDPHAFKEKIQFLLEKTKPREAPEQLIPIENELSKALGKISFELRISKVLETGVVAVSDFPICEGHLVTLNSPLFTLIGIEPPPLKVHNVKLNDKKFIVNFSFDRLSQESLEKVKSWLQITHKFN